MTGPLAFGCEVCSAYRAKDRAELTGSERVAQSRWKLNWILNAESEFTRGRTAGAKTHSTVGLTHECNCKYFSPDGICSKSWGQVGYRKQKPGAEGQGGPCKLPGAVGIFLEEKRGLVRRLTHRQLLHRPRT